MTPEEEALSRAPSELALKDMVGKDAAATSKKESLILAPEDKWIATLDVKRSKAAPCATHHPVHVPHGKVM